MKDIAKYSDQGSPPILVFPETHEFSETFKKLVNNLEMDLIDIKENQIDY